MALTGEASHAVETDLPHRGNDFYCDPRGLHQSAFLGNIGAPPGKSPGRAEAGVRGGKEMVMGVKQICLIGFIILTLAVAVYIATALG